jgi:hypothetical protein
MIVENEIRLRYAAAAELGRVASPLDGGSKKIQILPNRPVPASRK